MSNEVVNLKGFLSAWETESAAKQWCVEFSKSKLCPPGYQNKPGEVFMACNFGAQYGLSPYASLTSTYIINGRVTLFGDALRAIVTPHCDIEEYFDEKTQTAVCKIYRHGRKFPTVATFSFEDAKTAGCWGKAGPWKQYPKRMCAKRALSWAIHDAFPDLIAGVYSAEEMTDNPIDVTPKAEPTYDAPPAYADEVYMNGTSDAPPPEHEFEPTVNKDVTNDDNVYYEE